MQEENLIDLNPLLEKDSRVKKLQFVVWVIVGDHLQSRWQAFLTKEEVSVDFLLIIQIEYEFILYTSISQMSDSRVG